MKESVMKSGLCVCVYVVLYMWWFVVFEVVNSMLEVTGRPIQVAPFRLPT